MSRRVALFSFGHLVTDLVSGCIPALLLLYSATHDWSYAALSAIWLATSVSNALFQPLWGHVADRVHAHYLMPVGLVTNAVGIALVGFAGTVGSYGLIVVGAAVCGLGSSAFHPDAQHAVHAHSGRRPGLAMSWFQVAGNFGMAVGPLVVALLARGSDTRLMGLVGLPAVVGAVWLLRDALVSARHTAPAGGRAVAPSRAPEVRRKRGDGRRTALLALLGIVATRGTAQTALGTFVAFYYQSAFGWTPTEAQYFLFAYLAAGALGTLLGGHLADHVGERRVVVASFALLLIPALLARLLAPLLGAVFAVLCGFVSMSTWSVVTTYSQRLHPERVGMISGLMTGATIGMNGVASEVLGALADAAGLLRVLDLAVAVVVPAFLLSLALPDLAPAARSHEGRAEAAAI